ncbi:MAG: NAD(P)-dependent oxidoreductase [Gemmatimonadales bacterium]|nr:NAD(P)-dependent oxidoreductase [Gemmatimonadales bacterium]
MNRALDALLAEAARAGRPIRVGLIGAGVTGRAIALQLLTPPIGIHLLAVANRTVERAEQAFREGGAPAPVRVAEPDALDRVADAMGHAVTTDPSVLNRAKSIDVIVEVTGTQEFAARAVTEAIAHKKHVVLVNAELDSTLGSLLAAQARDAGVVLTNTDGDEPGVAMTLLRYLRSLGLETVAAGNLKGMIDHYRTPETQRAFAEQYGQDARKVTSFADATKLSMEATILANATGFRVGKRGMYGPKCAHISELPALLPDADLLAGGLVDFALGAAPHTGAFVIVHEPNPAKRRHLSYYKLGSGPFYAFYTPFHLPHIQIVSTIARAALQRDPTVAAVGAPRCETITIAKRDLRAGDVLDGVGGFCAYGLIENTAEARVERALPMGLSEGCRLRRGLPRDSVVRFDDVELPGGRLIDQLWEEQTTRFESALLSPSGTGGAS